MRYWYLGALLLAAGCNKAGFDAATIRPTYGWEDGCATVRISGSGFADDVSATIGGTDVLDITPAEAEEDREFFFFATTPAFAGSGEDSRAVDVVVTSDGEEATIPAAYYYVACPGSPEIESFGPDEDVSAGDTISLSGCGIDASGMSIQIVDETSTEVATATLTSDCGTAYASFTAPTAADGTYWVFIVDGSGDVVHPATGDPNVCMAQLDTAAVCDAPLTITYGGAR